MQSIAIFGGTFDPVHKGHLLASSRIQSAFQFDTYSFLPCNIPVLKPAAAVSKEHRIRMLQLALNEYPQFHLDLRELQRNSPSYMVDTLKSFRTEAEQASITLILGYDAFLSLPQWHQWEKIISLANLLVINRKGYTQKILVKPLKTFLAQHQSHNPKDLLNHPSGVLYQFDAGDYDISSISIREQLKKGEAIDSSIPQSVYEYIKEQGLYGNSNS